MALSVCAPPPAQDANAFADDLQNNTPIHEEIANIIHMVTEINKWDIQQITTYKNNGGGIWKSIAAETPTYYKAKRVMNIT